MLTITTKATVGGRGPRELLSLAAIASRALAPSTNNNKLAIGPTLAKLWGRP